MKRNADYRFDVQLAGGLAVESWFYEMTAGGDRFEVKNDRRALDTGSVYVEQSHDPGRSGIYRPSGIATSEADCWIFALGDPVLSFVGVSSERLRDVVSNFWRIGRQPHGSCPTMGTLLPLPLLLGQDVEWEKAA